MVFRRRRLVSVSGKRELSQMCSIMIKYFETTTFKVNR